MIFQEIRVALLLLILPITGCGTVANLAKPGPEQGGKAPFGGVRQDVICCKKAENGELNFGKHPNSEPKQQPQMGLMLLCAADVPFSFIGDVVTWPYTKTYTYINQPPPPPPVALPPPVYQTPSLTQPPSAYQLPPMPQASPPTSTSP